MVRPFLGLQRNTEAELQFLLMQNGVKITENVMFPVPMNNYFHHQKIYAYLQENKCLFNKVLFVN
jgi:hypothetical protein